jgi:hypothetical protein
LTGLTLTPTVPGIPVVQAPIAKTVDVEAILAKMPGVTVTGVTPVPGQVAPNVNDLLKQETDETAEDFEARSRLTLKLVAIPDYKLNNVTAVTAAHMMMKKSKLGLTYDPEVESALAYLTGLLQR